jgi:glycosyltransferase involved in cell wall biosynthesis
MKKIAVFMNSNETGGAERSLIYQLATQEQNKFTIFIPFLLKQGSLEKLVRDEGFKNVEYYDYPESLYSFSRTSFLVSPRTVWDALSLIFNKQARVMFAKYETVYLNGNKAAIYFFAGQVLSPFKGKVVWHLRDYYFSSKITDLFWSCFKKFIPNNLNFVCNSHSVEKNLKQSLWKNYPIDVIYNPVGGQIHQRDTRKTIKTLGVVAMLAPWKGVHEMLLWAKLYETELKNIGIEKIKIFGADIYKTVGEHNSYAKQLTTLKEKFKCDLISFEGNKNPQAIFQEIDCLIHYTLQPEPFGRVILEAFEAKIPVISTCLGGAAELVQSQITGIKVFPYDRRGLFHAVEKLSMNNVITFKLVKEGYKKSQAIQKDIPIHIAKVLETRVS